MSNKSSHRTESLSALRPDMSVQEFDDNYYYATELKEFARTLGIPIGNRRKIELEQLIREYLVTGHVPTIKPVLPRTSGEPRDRLAPDVVVKNYVGDKSTKTFLLELVRAQSPNLRDKSGQWYWLNDWRRRKQEENATFTYQDLADRLRELMQTSGRLPQIPSARMNNFITDFRADPASPPLSREQVLQEWQWLKKQPGPNTYEEYRRHKPHDRPT